MENKGNSVAHRVQVEPFSIGYRQVTFATIDTLAIGEKKKAIPDLNVSGKNWNSIFSLLREEWNAKIKATGSTEEAITFPVLINYADFKDKYRFTTEVEISYFPLRHEISKRAKNHGWTDWPHEAPDFEWRTFTHKPFTKAKRPS